APGQAARRPLRERRRARARPRRGGAGARPPGGRAARADPGLGARPRGGRDSVQTVAPALAPYTWAVSQPWDVLSARLLWGGGPRRVRLDTCRTAEGVEVRDYLVREVNDVAMVFALTPDGRVVLVRQYRHGVGEETLELPQGLCEDGETA